MLFSQSRILLATVSILSCISRTRAVATSEGCYKDDGSLTSQGSYAYQSEGYCSNLCSSAGYAVFAMSDTSYCSCGNSLPSGGTVSSSNCNLACSGYPSDICGGDGYYSVWLTGTGTLSGAAASSGGTANTAATSTTRRTTTTGAAAGTATTTAQQAPSIIYITTAVVQQGSTVVQTVSASTRAATAATSSSSASASARATSGKSGISGGAIAGIVIGVLAAAAIAAAAAFFLLRRRRQKEEAYNGEYKRQIEPAGAGYVNSPPSPDNRLDTSLAIRRNSSESLADNQDYSRKILRVVN